MAVHIPHVPATFIHIPKTAGSAFSEWLHSNCTVDNKSKHCDVDEAGRIWGDLGWTFCFVRNPWDRMVSYFHFIGQRAKTRILDRKNGVRVKKTTTLEHDHKLVDYYQLGFRNWLLDLHSNRENVYELIGIHHHHRRTPQWHWAKDVDQIFKVETLSQTFKDIQSLIGCEQPMPVYNTSDHGRYQDYYQDDTCDMVAEWFDVDIKNFDYEYSQ